MTQDRLIMTLVEGRYAVCRLAADAQMPAWASRSRFHSITRTPDELSVVCAESDVPEEIPKEPGWRLLKVQGPLDFSLTGILSSITTVLAKAGISVFAVSTFDTDYVMVKVDALDQAVRVLSKSFNVRSGHNERIVPMTDVFPAPIQKLPLADIPLEGCTAYRSQADTHQLLFMRFDRDVELPEHSHAAQWGVVLEGRIEMTIDGVTKTYFRGDRYFIPSGIRHSARIHASYADITFFDQKDRYRIR